MFAIREHHVFTRDDDSRFVHLKISAVQRRSSVRIGDRTKWSLRGMDLSQYRRIIIYALTFLAYAWSGYGAGLLSNLRDAVLAAESVFQDLFSNAITVARKIKDIHEVFDAAVEENCVFQCPDGIRIYLYTMDLIIALSDYLSNARRHWPIPIDSEIFVKLHSLHLISPFPLP